MKPQLSITDDGTHWVDLDSPVSDDPDDGYAGISDAEVAIWIAELEGILRERDEEWDKDVGVMRQRIAELEQELFEEKMRKQDAETCHQAISDDCRRLEAQLAEHGEKDELIRILREQVVRQADDIVYYKVLAEWYKDVRDKAVALADDTVKRFSRGV